VEDMRMSPLRRCAFAFTTAATRGGRGIAVSHRRLQEERCRPGATRPCGDSLEIARWSGRAPSRLLADAALLGPSLPAGRSRIRADPQLPSGLVLRRLLTRT
jgi:hypothetical protein